MSCLKGRVFFYSYDESTRKLVFGVNLWTQYRISCLLTLIECGRIFVTCGGLGGVIKVKLNNGNLPYTKQSSTYALSQLLKVGCLILNFYQSPSPEDIKQKHTTECGGLFSVGVAGNWLTACPLHDFPGFFCAWNSHTLVHRCIAQFNAWLWIYDHSQSNQNDKWVLNRCFSFYRCENEHENHALVCVRGQFANSKLIQLPPDTRRVRTCFQPINQRLIHSDI